jgi:hypothetical protein
VIIIKSLDAPKSIRETEKKPKNPLVWANNPKKPKKKPKKTQKNPKKTKKPQKTHWAGFFLKTRVFSNPELEPSKLYEILIEIVFLLTPVILYCGSAFV